MTAEPPSSNAQNIKFGARCPPVGAENLCRQAIFMDHASSGVAAPDAEVVHVGDAIWQRAKRGGLVQGAAKAAADKLVNNLTVAAQRPA